MYFLITTDLQGVNLNFLLDCLHAFLTSLDKSKSLSLIKKIHNSSNIRMIPNNIYVKVVNFCVTHFNVKLSSSFNLRECISLPSNLSVTISFFHICDL